MTAPTTLATPPERLARHAPPLLAALAILLGILASRHGVRLDGFLDLHGGPGEPPVPPVPAVADQIVSLVPPALVAWGAVRAFGATGRLGRLLAVIGAARLPVVLCAPLLFLLPAGGAAAEEGLALTGSMVVAGLGMVAAFAAAAALLARGIRAATGDALRGWPLAGACVLTLGGGELLAKLALAALDALR